MEEGLLVAGPLTPVRCSRNSAPIIIVVKKHLMSLGGLLRSRRPEQGGPTRRRRGPRPGRWAAWRPAQGRGAESYGSLWGWQEAVLRGRMGQTSEGLESHAGGSASVPRLWRATDSRGETAGQAVPG